MRYSTSNRHCFGYNVNSSPLPHKTPLEQEKAEKTPRKRKWLTHGCLPFLIGGLIGLVPFQIGPYPLPLNTMPIEGTVVIFNENGETIPFQPTRFTCFSRYAPAFSRSPLKRTHNFHVDEMGQFSHKIPEFTATLLFFTEDGKHAAVVDITPDIPPTGLVIELRPRYTVTGRVVHPDGTPRANQKMRLTYMRSSDFEMNLSFRITGRQSGPTKGLHVERSTTDVNGFFTINNVIPGIKYALYGEDYGFLGPSLKMPILEPEQYQEPFDLGDVSVSVR